MMDRRLEDPGFNVTGRVTWDALVRAVMNASESINGKHISGLHIVWLKRAVANAEHALAEFEKERRAK